MYGLDISNNSWLWVSEWRRTRNQDGTVYVIQMHIITSIIFPALFADITDVIL